MATLIAHFLTGALAGSEIPRLPAKVASVLLHTIDVFELLPDCLAGHISATHRQEIAGDCGDKDLKHRHNLMNDKNLHA